MITRSKDKLKWEPVAIVRQLWPHELVTKLYAGETVYFDGYFWRKSK